MVQSGIHNLIYFLLAAFFSHDSFEVVALVEIALFIFPKSEKKKKERDFFVPEGR